VRRSNIAPCTSIFEHLLKKQSLRSAFPPATTAGRCLHPIFLLKPINPSADIDKPLYPSIEGMAFRTNFHFNVFSCASCWNDFSASTCHRGLFVFRVNFFFHVFTFFPIWIKAQYVAPANDTIPVNYTILAQITLTGQVH